MSTTGSDRSAEVGIVGAGIAGSTLAIACRQAGLEVRIYERNKRDDAVESEADALLELNSNGARVLHALGLKSELSDAALIPEFSTLRSASTGLLLSQRPLGAFSTARYGAPCYLIAANRLQALLNQATAREQIPVEHAALITAVETDSARLTVTDGSTLNHVALAIAVGAATDANEHALANLLEAREWQLDSTVTVIRARCKRPLDSRDHHRFINTWLLRAGYCVERPRPNDPSADQQVELMVMVVAPRPELSPAEALRKLLLGSHAHLQSLLDGLIEATYLQQPVAAVAEFWHAGRTALLGGACHAPLPGQDLGPDAALEDAWILSRMMERWEEQPHQGFADYARFRRPRAQRLARFDTEQNRILTLTQTRDIWLRNIRWSMTSRFLPEIAMQKLDWLYGYDCIKGFD